MKKIFYYDTYAGRIGIAEEDGAITHLIFSERDWTVEETDLIKETKRQLDEYFAGKRTEFDVPLLFAGTDFQKTVWNALLNIPYGKTVSYATLSQDLGKLKAIRAVAAANGANSISILVPCHRVIGSNQKLVGYAGGLPAKQWLLDLESSG